MLIILTYSPYLTDLQICEMSIRRVTEEAERSRAELERQPGALFDYREAAEQAARTLQQLSARNSKRERGFC